MKTKSVVPALVAAVVLVVIAANLAAAAPSYINEARVNLSVADCLADGRYVSFVRQFGLDPTVLRADRAEVANLPASARGKFRWGLRAEDAYEWGNVTPQESAAMPGVIFDLGLDPTGGRLFLHAQRGITRYKTPSGEERVEYNAMMFYGVLSAPPAQGPPGQQGKQGEPGQQGKQGEPGEVRFSPAYCPPPPPPAPQVIERWRTAYVQPLAGSAFQSTAPAATTTTGIEPARPGIIGDLICEALGVWGARAGRSRVIYNIAGGSVGDVSATGTGGQGGAGYGGEGGNAAGGTAFGGTGYGGSSTAYGGAGGEGGSGYGYGAAAAAATSSSSSTSTAPGAAAGTSGSSGSSGAAP